MNNVKKQPIRIVLFGHWKKVQTSSLLCIKYINQRVVIGKAAALVLFFDDLPTLSRTVDRMCDWTGISPCLCFHFVCVCMCICVGVGNSHDLGPYAPLEYISGGLSLWLTNARHWQTREVQAVGLFWKKKFKFVLWTMGSVLHTGYSFFWWNSDVLVHIFTMKCSSRYLGLICVSNFLSLRDIWEKVLWHDLAVLNVHMVLWSLRWDMVWYWCCAVFSYEHSVRFTEIQNH